MCFQKKFQANFIHEPQSERSELLFSYQTEYRIRGKCNIPKRRLTICLKLIDWSLLIDLIGVYYNIRQRTGTSS